MRNWPLALTPNYRGGIFGSAIDPASLPSAVGIYDTYNPDFLRIKTAAHFTRASNQSLEGTGLDMSSWSGFTVEGWFKLDTVSGNTGFVCKWGGNGANQDFHIWMRSSTNQAEFRVNTASGSHVITNTTVLTTGTWYFISATYDPSTGDMSFKINDANEITGTKPDAENFQASVQKFEVGEVSSLSTTNMDGDADQIILYDRVLTDAERTAHYNDGDGVDISANDTPNKRHAWRMNELNNTRFDSIGGIHLSDVGGVTQVNGHVPELGRMEQQFKSAQFTAANNEYLNNTSTDFNFGDTDFSICGWFYSSGVSGTNAIISKYNSGQIAYLVDRNGTKVRLIVSNNGSTQISVLSNITISANTWYYFCIVHDSVNDEIKVCVNNESFVTTTHSGGVFNSTANLEIGSRSGGSGANWDGRLEAFKIYTKALTQSESDAIYNSGAGQSYANIDKEDLLAYWALDEVSGTRVDSHGSYDLTDNNTVTQADGRVGSPIQVWSVGCWEDRSGNGNHFVQETIAARPDFDGDKVSLDGLAQFLSSKNGATPFASNSEGEVMIIAQNTTATGGVYGMFSVGDDTIDTDFVSYETAASGSEYWAINMFNDGAFYYNKYVLGSEGLDKMISSYSSDGAENVCHINNVDVEWSEHAGVDTGQWFHDLAAPNSSKIGLRCRASGGFAQGYVYGIYVFNQKLTQAQRDGISLFANNKYNVYTPITKLSDVPNLEYAWYNKAAEESHIEGIDPSRAKALVNLLTVTPVNAYTSDFSVDEDGHNGTRATTVRVDSAFGETDCLKIYADNTPSTHFDSFSIGGLAVGELYRVKFKYRVPSTNTIVDGFDCAAYVNGTDVSHRLANGGDVVYDEWKTVEYKTQLQGTNTQLYLYLLNGTSRNFTGANDVNDDYILIKDIVVDNITNKEFIQTVASAMPNPEVDSVDFDGVGEYMESPDLFTAIANDTAGEWVVKFDDDEGSGVFNSPINFSFDVNNYWLLRLTNADRPQIAKNNGGTGSTVDFDTVTRGGEVDLSLGSDDTSYICFDSYKQLSVNSGSSNGQMQGDNANLTDLALFSYLAGGAYYAGGLKQLFYVSGRQLGYDERRQFKKFRDTL